jgi:membrane protease YdiL (CAAX protease family)
MARKTLLVITVFVEGGLFLLGLLLTGGLKAELWSGFSVSWGATVYALLLCLPMLAMLYLTVRSHWKHLSRLTKEIDEKVTPIFAQCKFIDLVVIALFAGLGEELFFRGWLQGALTNRFDVWAGILIASAIFGFAHYLSPTYAIYAGLTGLYLGVIYRVSGNLYVVMIIHALYDFIALLYLVRNGEGSQQ